MSDAPTTESPKPALSLLASEIFGSEFHGEVNRAKTPDPVDAPADVGDIEQPERLVEPEQPSETDEVPITSLRELIEANEWDEDWFNSLDIPVKIDHETGSAKLKDLVNSYQIQTAAEKRLEAAKAKAADQEKAFEARQEEIEQTFQVAAKLITKAKAKLQREASKVDLEALRERDPAEWAAKKAEFAEQEAEIRAMEQEAITEYQRGKQTAQQKILQSHQEHLQKEYQALLEKLPEWKDPEKAKAEQGRVSEYLINQGLSPEEVAQASDHRLVVLARKAMLYDQMQQKSEPAKKKLSVVPKTLKPGAPKSAEKSNQERVAELQHKLKTTGDERYAMELIRMRRGN